jgi:glycosyltransferase involved in cell wall biosynthesis
MGAVHFSIDRRLLARLTELLPLKVFVETGTYEGDSVEAATEFFDELHTIELSEELFGRAADRFEGSPQVHVHQGSSPDVLGELSGRLRRRSVLYWLDAHWCGEGSARGEVECPLLFELEAIGSLAARSVVMIDDARLFLAPPPAPSTPQQWPTFSELLARLSALRSDHELTVIDDVIIFFPPGIREPLRSFARENAIDWLAELTRGRDLDRAVKRISALDAGLDGVQAKVGKLQYEIADLSPQLSELQAAVRETAAETQAQALRAMQRQEALVARVEAVYERLAPLDAQEDLFRRVLENARATQAHLDALRRKGPNAQRLARPPRTRLGARVHRSRERALGRYRRTRSWVWVWLRRFRPSPKVGSLEHHEPMRLNVPRRYANVSPPADPPTVSIVTPSYNYGVFLERTIRSVLDQGYPALEYIVRDGGSDDGTREILERYAPRLANWACEPDLGQANAINRGMAHATGEIMAYLNSDDLLLPGSVSYVASYLAKHPEVDVVYGHRVLIDQDDMEIGRWVLPRHDDALLDWVDYVPQETLFWRRGIWEAVGGRMDGEFRFALDWDLLLRFRDADAKIVRLPRFLGAFRVHSAQKTSAQADELGAVEMARLRSRVLGREPERAEILHAMRGYLVRHIILHKLYRARILRY